jgi:beta-aspartyl-peptidase (threonine type)
MPEVQIHRIARLPLSILLLSILLRSILLLSILLLSILSAPLPAFAAGATHDPRADIETVIRAQVEAWNGHDLDAFMMGYWKSPQLTFFAGAKENHGWQAAIDRYRAAYTGPGKEMGKLEFSGLRIEMMGPDAAFVRGAWLLTMPDGKSPDGKKPHGLFTLIFRKFPEGWKIVHDHTSAAD